MNEFINERMNENPNWQEAEHLATNTKRSRGVELLN